jgi:type II secretory pathway component PulC
VSTYTILQHKLVPKAALIAALIYLLYVICSIFIFDGRPPHSDALAAQMELKDPDTIESKRLNLELMKNWHLFGQPLVKDNKPFDGQHIPQETQLQLKLLGVFFLPDQQRNSYVIIQAQDQFQNKYRSGDELPDGTKIESISKARVILLRDNQRESLSMDRKGNEVKVKT